MSCDLPPRLYLASPKRPGLYFSLTLPNRAMGACSMNAILSIPSRRIQLRKTHPGLIGYPKKSEIVTSVGKLVQKSHGE